MQDKITFSFGENWQNFVTSIDEDSISNAKLSLTEFLGLENLKGKSFLDIGCGSGLFSYAAFNLGATKIVSFDVDPLSVQSCKYLYAKANNPENWEIYSGSVLDNNFISGLEKSDIVYSWGVLHHTGKMFEAIKNAARLVNKDGYFFIAIYNKKEGVRGSKFWLRIKKLYNSSPSIGKRILETLYILSIFGSEILKFKNPLRITGKKGRGMRFRTDIIDWIGGLPYEFATVDEITSFMGTEFPDFNLVNVKRVPDLSNNWFLFKRF
jgi:2-polyprenyl-3-methyl-5-hydroxy-6-metoxy-1,4-benzoquinol methylase